MKSAYEISFKSQAFIAKELSLRLAVLLCGMLVLARFYRGEYDVAIDISLALFLIFELIPSTTLHMQYLFSNYRFRVGIDRDARIITIRDVDTVHAIDFADIVSVKAVLSSDLYKGGRRGWLSWALYHYVIIETNDNKTFVLTCLLINDVHKLFEDLGFAVFKERMPFPLVWMKAPKSKDGW